MKNILITKNDEDFRNILPQYVDKRPIEAGMPEKSGVGLLISGKTNRTQ